MSDPQTVAQQGQVRLYREADVADIDINRLLLAVGDGLADTEINGYRRSYKQTDGDGTLVVRRIVRGDGVNTVFADSGTISDTENILGMVVLTDGTDVRVAVSGSIIGGFVGLTKHAVYYLGTSGQISLTPGTIPVQVGVAVSTTELLLQICPCRIYGELALEKCFSSSQYECTDGATYTLYGSTAGAKIPALIFEPSVDNNWYCGFPTPPDMDTTQAAELKLLLAAPDVFPAVNSRWVLSYRSNLAAQHLFTGGVATTLAAQLVLPAAQHTVVSLAYPITAGAIVSGAFNRQTLLRSGDTYLGRMMVFGATFRYARSP